jgi:hypothetical protein
MANWDPNLEKSAIVRFPEMKFLNGILIEVSGRKLESSQTRVFHPQFSFLQNAIHK